jgi:transcriptional regulator with XRE-family HTH domain
MSQNVLYNERLHSPGLLNKEMDVEVGRALRRAREAAGFSQRELARRAGVSNGTVSQIEQDRLSPSIGLLKRVLDGLDVPLARFFADPAEPDHRLFFGEADLVELSSQPGISYRQLGNGLGLESVQILHERYSPGTDTGATPLSHEGEEGGIVITGRLEVTVDGRMRVLKSGDGYYFPSRLPHRFRNPGSDVCEVISACTPPTF